MSSVLSIQDKRLSLGDESAPVKIVEYADILCPYCAQANANIIPRIKADYIDTKKAHYEVRLVGRIAPDSKRAAIGAYCAAEQGKFFDYLDTAYTRTWSEYYSQNKSPEDIPLFSELLIKDFAKRLGLEMTAWDTCLTSGKYDSVLAANQAKMREIEAYGTPHFIINDRNYSGAPPYPAFQAVIDGELKKQEAK